MPNIGIVGAGVAGLHLGLFLRKHDIPVTIHTERVVAELADGPLPNAVVHHAPTLDRERRLDVGFWPVEEYGYSCHHYYVGGPQPMFFSGDLDRWSSAVDYRLYLPRLAEAFENRGGRVELGVLGAEDVDRLGARYDLVVVAAGRGAFASLFPRRDELSPYRAPQRRLCVGLYHGITPATPNGLAFNISPQHGELVEMPIYSRHGHVTGLLFENVPGGDLEVLSDLSYRDDPTAFHRTVLDRLARHYPRTFERVDPARFGLTDPRDLLQGTVTPAVRQDYARLSDGTFALAVGDAHAVLDPLLGQGANIASHSAWVAGEAIVEDVGFDELFCRRVAARRSDVVLGAAHWTNLMLAPPEEHLLGFIAAMAEHKAVADAFTNNVGHPDRQWRILATPDRTRAFLAHHDRLRAATAVTA
jgi:2-polyprenyl-6-methoxyphenol hydroxylase-like FAD-dependent oxidoreductase